MASKGRHEENVQKCKRKLDLAKAALARETSEQKRLQKEVEDALWYAERGQKTMKEATEVYKELREIAKLRLNAYSAKVKLLDKLENTFTRAMAAHRAAMFLEETEKHNEGILRKVRKAAQAKTVEAKAKEEAKDRQKEQQPTLAMTKVQNIKTIGKVKSPNREISHKEYMDVVVSGLFKDMKELHEKKVELAKSVAMKCRPIKNMKTEM